MPKFVKPEVFLVGATQMEYGGVHDYLRATGQEDFEKDIFAARLEGVPMGMALCSMYAKMCYAALTVGKNTNVTRTRSIPDNIEACFAQGHSSVFEHCSLNFVVTNCSRILTHEQVRHRVGTAYSQTSGRYVALEDISFVHDPVLDSCRDIENDLLQTIEDSVYLMQCRTGLRKPPAGFPNILADNVIVTKDERTRWVPDDSVPFDRKKKVTSAIRRVAPNGQANELGMTLNVRTLRHCLELRTAPGCEWEIRYVYNEVYKIVKAKFPQMMFDATEVDTGDGLVAVTGMHHQPYQKAE